MRRTVLAAMVIGFAMVLVMAASIAKTLLIKPYQPTLQTWQKAPGAINAGSMPIRASSDWGHLRKHIKPSYPAAAKRAGVHGTVRIHALIGRDGRPRELSVISGPAALREAALTAVWQWQYEPTLLNGGPVEIITDILIDFTLNQ